MAREKMVMVGFYCPAELRSLALAASRHAGIAPSEWYRRAVADGVERHLDSLAAENARLKEMLCQPLPTLPTV